MNAQWAERWWANPELSRTALGLVDQGNVRFGVGTSVLGYHGLAMEQLLPLSGSTLVDARKVADAIQCIDLAPVAHALSKAVYSEVGSSSEEYGRLLANDIHQQALEGTIGLFASLVGSGMAYPTAADRVISVHGVPATRLGAVSKHLRESKLGKDTLDDWSDRALMEFALHYGALQCTLSEITKSDAFEEKEHPRSNDGRFRDKGAPSGAGPSERTERAERKDRRLRRMKKLVSQQGALKAMAARAEEKRAAELKRVSLPGAEMKRALLPVAPAERSKSRMVYQARSSRATVNKPRAVGEVESAMTPEERTLMNLESNHSQREKEHSMVSGFGELFVVMRSADYQKLLPAFEEIYDFSAGGFAMETKEPFVARTAKDVQNYVQAEINKDPAAVSSTDFILLEMPSQVPLYRGDVLGESEQFTIPLSARFNIPERGVFMEYTPFTVEQRTGNPGGGVGDVPLRYVSLSLTNEDQFPLQHQNDNPPKKFNAPLPHDSDDDGRVRFAYAFEEKEHPRSQDGRFRDDGQPPEAGKVERENRNARRRRRIGRQQMLAAQLSRVRAAQKAAADEQAINASQTARQLQALPQKSPSPSKKAKISRLRDSKSRMEYRSTQGNKKEKDLSDAFFKSASVHYFSAAASDEDGDGMLNFSLVTGFQGEGLISDPEDLRNDHLQDTDVTIEEILGVAGYADGKETTSSDVILKLGGRVKDSATTSKTKVVGNQFTSEEDAITAAEMYQLAHYDEIKPGMAFAEPFDSQEGETLYTASILLQPKKQEPQHGIIFYEGNAEAMLKVDPSRVGFMPAATKNGRSISTLRDLIEVTGATERYGVNEFPDVKIQAVVAYVRDDKNAFRGWDD